MWHDRREMDDPGSRILQLQLFLWLPLPIQRVADAWPLSRGEPILNPVTKAEHRVRIDSPNGFEFKLAEVGRGWSKTKKPMQLDLADSYGHFCHLNLSQSGMID